MLAMFTRPTDASPPAWQAQLEALARMDPQSRVRAAIDLSEAVRELQIQGALARHPSWRRSDAVDWLVARLTGQPSP